LGSLGIKREKERKREARERGHTDYNQETFKIEQKRTEQNDSWALDLTATMEHTWDEHSNTSGPHKTTLCDEPFLRRTTEKWSLRNDTLSNHENIRDVTEQVNDRLQEGMQHSHVTVRHGEDHQEELLEMAAERKHRTTIVALSGTVRITVQTEEPPVKTLIELRKDEAWTIPNCNISGTGNYMKISPSTKKAMWAEIRTTKNMRKKRCRNGGECSFQVCAFSNHTTTDQSEEEKERHGER
jgi:hypothetical protein